MAGHAGGHRDHVLLGDPVLDEPVGLRELERRARGSRRRGRRRARRAAARAPRARAAPRRRPRRRTRRVTPRHGTPGAPAPLSGSPWRLPSRSSSSGGATSSASGARPSAVDPLAQPALELAGRRGEVLVTGRARVPAVRAAALGERPRVLHERDALALDRLRDEDAGRSVRVLARALRRRCRSAAWSCPSHVTTRQPNARSFASRLSSARISSVVLSDWSSLRSTTTSSRPTRWCAAACSASQFWPSWSSPSPVITTTRPPRPRCRFAHAIPRAFEIPIPSEPGVRLDPRHADVRVTVEAAEPAEPQQALGRDHAERVERCVEARDVVALGREEDVAVGGVEADLGDVQVLPEEVDDEVERAEGRAEMPGAGALDRGERVQPAHVREEREPGVGVERGGRDALELAAAGSAQGQPWHAAICSPRRPASSPSRSLAGRSPRRPARSCSSAA